MRRIAIIGNGFVRDVQIFVADPEATSDNEEWEDHFSDFNGASIFLGIYEGAGETEIREAVASKYNIHPNTISLVNPGV